MAKKAELHYDGKKYDLPVIIGTENEIAIDIKADNKNKGKFFKILFIIYTSRNRILRRIINLILKITIVFFFL